MSLKSHCTKRLLLFCILFSLLFAGLYAWYSVMAADTLFANGFLLNFLYFVCDLVRSLFFSVIIGYLAYGLYRFGFKGSISLFLITLEILLFHHMATVVAMAIPDAAWEFDKLSVQIFAVLSDLVWEFLIFSVFILISFLIIKTAERPMRLCGLVGAILWFLPTFLNNLIFDIQYGLPTSFAEWLQFLLYWCLDLLVFLALPYFTVQFISYKSEKHAQ